MAQQKIKTKQTETKKKVSVPTEVKNDTKQTRQVTYPVLSFILFLVASVIYFFVGNLFMQLAVKENFCEIRYLENKKPTGAVVAILNGESIYMSDVQDYIKRIPQLAELPLETIYPQLLETVIDARVLKMAAQKAGTVNNPEVQQALEMAYEQIIAQAYLENELKALVTPERIQALYDEEIKNFKPVEEVSAKHILVKTEQEARDILIQLRAGIPFENAANKYSMDKSTPDGNLGYFTQDMMIPEFSKAVFALKKGQISEPVKTPFGWHIILLEDKRLSTPPALEEVQGELRDILMKQDVKTVIDNERKKLNVQIVKPTL